MAFLAPPLAEPRIRTCNLIQRIGEASPISMFLRPLQRRGTLVLHPHWTMLTQTKRGPHLVTTETTAISRIRR
jgi:hypothetical protein